MAFCCTGLIFVDVPFISLLLLGRNKIIKSVHLFQVRRNVTSHIQVNVLQTKEMPKEMKHCKVYFTSTIRWEIKCYECEGFTLPPEVSAIKNLK